jgi:hypothetical protein
MNLENTPPKSLLHIGKPLFGSDVFRPQLLNDDCTQSEKILVYV